MHFSPALAASLAACLASASTASAQSSLGLNFVEAELTAASGASGGAARITGDYRITGAHGVQMDLSATDEPGGFLGRIDGHLYMMPTEDSKYGLMASLADIDGRSGTIGMAGVEGMLRLDARMVIEARAVAGLAQPGSVDFVAADAGVTRQIGERTAVTARLALAEFDEAAFSTVAYAADIGVMHSLAGTGFEISASLGVSGSVGDAVLAREGVARIGMTWRFGVGSGAARGLAERAFGRAQPAEELLRRGLF
jgi:hypothetical protein